MRPIIREALCVSVLILVALASSVYISERISLRQAFQAGMTEFWQVYDALKR